METTPTAINSILVSTTISTRRTTQFRLHVGTRTEYEPASGNCQLARRLQRSELERSAIAEHRFGIHTISYSRERTSRGLENGSQTQPRALVRGTAVWLWSGRRES